MSWDKVRRFNPISVREESNEWDFMMSPIASVLGKGLSYYISAATSGKILMYVKMSYDCEIHV